MRLSIAHKVKMLTLTASALLATMGAAGQRSVGSREFFVGDGVPGSVVRGMDVSEDGVLWVSGRSGLAFFDGYEFRRVGYQGATINNLTTIKAIGTKGVLGLAQNYQPYYYDISHDCFRHAMPGGIEPQCYNIYTTPGRRVWVTTRDSLFCAPFGELERGGPLSAFVVEGGLETGQFHKVEADSRGREWVFCDGGLVSAESRALVSRQTYDHIGEHSGRVFFVGRQGDVGEYDEGHQVVVRHDARRVADELMSTQTSAQGILYAGGARHLWRIDLRDERAQWEAIADGTYYLLRQDVRGRIWAVGEEKEMVVVGPGGEVRAVGLEGGPRGVSATRQPVWVEDRDGVVWAATRGGSLSYYDEGRGVMVSPEQPAVDITYWSRGCDGRESSSCACPRRASTWWTCRHSRTFARCCCRTTGRHGSGRWTGMCSTSAAMARRCRTGASRRAASTAWLRMSAAGVCLSGRRATAFSRSGRATARFAGSPRREVGMSTTWLSARTGLSAWRRWTAGSAC